MEGQRRWGDGNGGTMSMSWEDDQNEKWYLSRTQWEMVFVPCLISWNGHYSTDSNTHWGQTGHLNQWMSWAGKVREVGGDYSEPKRSSNCYCLGRGAQSCQGFQCFTKYWSLKMHNVKHCASQERHMYGPDGACRWSVCHPLYPLLAPFPEVGGCPSWSSGLCCFLTKLIWCCAHARRTMVNTCSFEKALMASRKWKQRRTWRIIP